MGYEKRMIYLSYMQVEQESEKRICNGGHVKLEHIGNKVILDMQVKLKNYAHGDMNIHEDKYEVIILGNDKSLSLGMIYLRSGAGNFRREIGQQFKYEDICEIQVKINENNYIIGKIKDFKINQYKTEPLGKEWQYTILNEDNISLDTHYLESNDSIENQLEIDEVDLEAIEATETIEKIEAAEAKETVEKIKTAETAEVIEISEIAKTVEAEIIPEVLPSSPKTYKGKIQQILHEIRMTPDKWQQLLKNYKNMSPYSDERLYISLEPKDFVIMSSEYQQLAHNSFLLHGYYNYRHIILGKENNEYYLGVPGVFYEREKNVAMMFGFDLFECEGGKPSNGVFGYYLRKVKI